MCGGLLIEIDKHTSKSLSPLRPKRKPQKFGESGEEGGRQRFRPRNKKKEEAATLPPAEAAANEIPRTPVDTVATPVKAPASPGRKEFIPRGVNKRPTNADVSIAAATAAATAEPSAVVKANKFSGFLRRPRPIGGSGTAATAGGPTVLPSTAEIPAAGTTEETSAGTEVDSGRFVEFVPTLPPATTTLAPTATTRFQLEDFFGTPESVAASELSAARGDAATAAAFSPSARLVDAQRPPLLGSEDISENLILEEVRSRTAAITGETASKPTYTVKKPIDYFPVPLSLTKLSLAGNI
jgi:hypothetical protein